MFGTSLTKKTSEDRKIEIQISGDKIQPTNSGMDAVLQGSDNVVIFTATKYCININSFFFWLHLLCLHC